MFETLLTIRDKLEQQQYTAAKALCAELSRYPLESQLENLLKLVEQERFPEALTVIEKVIRYVSIPKYHPDFDLSGLKTVESFLEIQLSALEFKKAELYRLINNFRIRYNQELGGLISEMLKIRKELLFIQLEENPDVATEHQEAEQDYERYQRVQQESKDIAIKALKQADRKQLQKLFRCASKLCHPDLVEEGSKAQAERIFSTLNSAYYHNDVEGVRNILTQLESGQLQLIFIDQAANEKQRLENYLSQLRLEVQRLKQEVDEMENSDAYLTIIELDDWAAYFQQLKVRLKQEVAAMKDKLNKKQ